MTELLVPSQYIDSDPSWVPTSFIRPRGRTNDPLLALQSTLTSLGMLIIHSPVGLTRFNGLIDKFKRINQDAYGWDWAASDSFRRFVVDSTSHDTLFAMISTVQLLFKGANAADPPADTNIALFGPKGRAVWSNDKTVMASMTYVVTHQGGTPQENTSLLLETLQTLEALCAAENFCVGRGAFIPNDAWDVSARTELTANPIADKVIGFLARGIFTFDALNFSWKKISHKVFEMAPLAADLFTGAARCFMGSPGSGLETLEKTVPKMITILTHKPQRQGAIENLRNNNVIEIFKARKRGEESRSIDKAGGAAGFFIRKKQDHTYDPLLGFPVSNGKTVSRTVSPAMRKKIDDSGVRLMQLAYGFVTKVVTSRDINYRLLKDFVGGLGDCLKDVNGSGGRKPDNINDADLITFEEFADQTKSEVVQTMEDDSSPDSLPVKAMLTSLLDQPSMYATMDESGDIADTKDIKAEMDRATRLEDKLDDSQTEVKELKDTVRRLSFPVRGSYPQPAGTPALVARSSPAPVSLGTGYINWRPTRELICLASTSWATPSVLLSLINTLHGLSFKYDTQRDRARQLLGEAFTIRFDLGQSNRFPVHLTIVPRDVEDVYGAVNNILAALNYKNDDPSNGGPRSQTDASRNIRGATTYSDAALNYTKAVGEFKDAILRNTLTYVSFEEKYGLVWI